MDNFRYDYAGMGKWLRGPEARAMTTAAGERARVLYQSVVAHRTGKLAESAAVSMSIGRNGRPVARLVVGGDSAPYGLAHEFGTADGVQSAHHDLVTVLGMLR